MAGSGEGGADIRADNSPYAAETVCAPDGSYQLAFLPPGSYQLEATLPRKPGAGAGRPGRGARRGFKRLGSSDGGLAAAGGGLAAAGAGAGCSAGVSSGRLTTVASSSYVRDRQRFKWTVRTWRSSRIENWRLLYILTRNGNLQS